jgi:branched-chain amino acid transport system substrate-binding protein
MKVEVLTADHQNKADVAARRRASGSTPTRSWTMLIGGTNSGTALAMAKITQEKEAPLHRQSAPPASA